MTSYRKFSPNVSGKIGHYVYRLVDPRTGHTFYVGMGKNNRIFDHLEEASKGKSGDKCEKIRDIHKAGLQVITLIHRHGLNKGQAPQVEAALMDAYQGLTNIQSGHGASDYGCQSTRDVIKGYGAPLANFGKEKIVLISISSGWNQNERNLDFRSWKGVYEQTRYCWRINTQRAAKADHIVAHALGLIRGVFVVDEWLPSDHEEFAGYSLEPIKGKSGFVGSQAPKESWEKYFEKRIPDKYRKSRGQPIQYTYE